MRYVGDHFEDREITDFPGPKTIRIVNLGQSLFQQLDIQPVDCLRTLFR